MSANGSAFLFLLSLIMKKFILTALFFIVSVCSFAQKSYLHVISEYNPCLASNYDKTDIFLYGDIPSDMNNKYSSAKISEIFDMLTENGYTLDFVTSLSGTRIGIVTNDRIIGSIVYIFSKSSGGASNVRSVTIDNDEEATEIARYNLQGMPVNANEKGVQIIVYSNYTAKTIIVK